MMRLLEHKGQSIVIEVDGQRIELLKRVNHYIKRRGRVHQEVERWMLDELQTVNLTRPVLPVGDIPVGPWRIGEG